MARLGGRGAGGLIDSGAWAGNTTRLGRMGREKTRLGKWGEEAVTVGGMGRGGTRCGAMGHGDCQTRAIRAGRRLIRGNGARRRLTSGGGGGGGGRGGGGGGGGGESSPRGYGVKNCNVLNDRVPAPRSSPEARTPRRPSRCSLPRWLPLRICKSTECQGEVCPSSVTQT